jgi:hypothetical protein
MNAIRTPRLLFTVLFLAGLTHFSSAQMVIFNFSGTLQLKSDPNNVLPASITQTSAFTGTVSYDTSVGPDNAPGDVTYGYYIYGTSGGFSMRASVEGNVFVSHTPTNAPFDVFIIHDQTPGTPYDELAYEASTISINGEPFTGGVTRANMDVDLQDQASVAISTDVRPEFAPILEMFPSLRRWGLYGGDDHNNRIFYLEGTITNITAIQPLLPSLSITPTMTNTMILSWERAASPGFVLEENATITGIWSQVPFPYETNGATVSINVPGLAASSFYRLHKP